MEFNADDGDRPRRHVAQRHGDRRLGLRLAHVEDGKANHVPVLINLLQHGVGVRFPEAPLPSFEDHLQVIALAVVPDGYVVAHNTSPRLIGSAKDAVMTMDPLPQDVFQVYNRLAANGARRSH